MKSIDLNKKRKARAAKREKDEDEPVIILIGEEKLKLPAELPAEFAFKASEGDTRGALTALLNGQADAFFAESPSLQDVMDLMSDVSEVYGFDSLGESEASADSS